MIETVPTPLKSRWLVWTDAEAQARLYSPHDAVWFWSASGPRGHASGAESTPDEAVNRAMLAAAQLESSQRRKP